MPFSIINFLTELL